MPLHGDEKLNATQLDRLNETIRGRRGYDKAFREVANALMMHAVDLTLARPDNLGQVRPLADGHGVGEMVPSVPVPEGEVVVLDRRGPLGGEVMHERPGRSEVGLLESWDSTNTGIVVR